MRHKLISLAREHIANRILIEEAGPGLHLVQELRANQAPGVPVAIGIRVEDDKVVRMEAQSARFEAGQILLPERAPWLAEFLKEILAFPNARHDNQIDSISQSLNWADVLTSGNPKFRSMARFTLENCRMIFLCFAALSLVDKRNYQATLRFARLAAIAKPRIG